MKRRIKKFAGIVLVLSITSVALSSCGIHDQEVFDEIPNQVDEENEKKSKP